MSTSNGANLPNINNPNYSGQVNQSDSNQDQSLVSAGQPGAGGYMPSNQSQQNNNNNNMQPQDLNSVNVQSMPMGMQQPYIPGAPQMGQTPQNQSSLLGNQQMQGEMGSGGYQPSSYTPSNGNIGSLNTYGGAPANMPPHQMMQPFGLNPMAQNQMQQNTMANQNQNNSMQSAGGPMGGNNNSSSQSQLNNKYKTQRCWHFDNGGNCSMGDNCHFAHGDTELRESTQPIPIDMLSQAQRRVPSGLQGRGGKPRQQFGGRGGSSSYNNNDRGGGDTGRGGFRDRGSYQNNNLNGSGSGAHQGYQHNINANVAGAASGMPGSGNAIADTPQNTRGAFRKPMNSYQSRGGSSALGGDRPHYQKSYNAEGTNTFNGGRGGMQSDAYQNKRGENRGGRGGSMYQSRGGDNYRGSSRGDATQGASRGDAKVYQGRGGYLGSTQAPTYSATTAMGSSLVPSSPSQSDGGPVNIGNSNSTYTGGLTSSQPQQMPTPFQFSASAVGVTGASAPGQFMGFSGQQQQQPQQQQNNNSAGHFQNSNQSQSMMGGNTYQGGYTGSQNNADEQNQRVPRPDRNQNQGNWGGRSDSNGQMRSRDNGDRDQQMNNKQNNPNYKTDMCKFFEQRKQCPYQARCSFAHGKKELRPKPAGMGGQPGGPTGGNYQNNQYISGGSGSNYVGHNSRGGGSAGVGSGYSGYGGSKDNNDQNAPQFGLAGSGYLGQYTGAAQTAAGAHGLYNHQGAFQSDLLMGVQAPQQSSGGPQGFYSSNAAVRQGNPNQMFDSSLMVTGTSPMQSQQNQLLSMYVNNAANLQQQWQVTMLMHDAVSNQVYKRPITIVLTQNGANSGSSIQSSIQKVIELSEQGISSEAEQILHELQSQNLIQIQEPTGNFLNNGANEGDDSQDGSMRATQMGGSTPIQSPMIIE